MEDTNALFTVVKLALSPLPLAGSSCIKVYKLHIPAIHREEKGFEWGKEGSIIAGERGWMEPKKTTAKNAHDSSNTVYSLNVQYR